MSKSAEKAAEDLQAILAGISTKDLVDELAKREGVKEITAPDPGWTYLVKTTPYAPEMGREDMEADSGPARILVVID